MGVYATVFPDSISRLAIYQPNHALQLLQTRAALLQKHPSYNYYYAKAYSNLGRYIESDSIVELELKSSKLKGDSALYVQLMLLNAENKKVLDQYEDAFVSLETIYGYQKRNNDSLGLLNLMITFAEYYRSTHNFSQALSYINKAEQFGNTLGNGFPPLIKTRLMNRKAAIYLENDGPEDSVVNLSLEVIRLAKLYNDPVQVAISSNELGFFYSNKRKFLNKAESYLKNAIRIWDSLDYGIYANNAIHNLARHYIYTKHPSMALPLAYKQMDIAIANGWKKEEGVWHAVLSTAYADLGNYRLAYEHQHQASQISMMNAYNQFNQRLAYYSNRLGLKEKEELLLQKEREVLNTNEKLTVEQTQNRWLVTVVVLLAVILVMAVTAVVINIRQKQVMKTQRKKIDSINQTLTALVNEKETLLKEINHRVKNNLSILSSIIYLKERKGADVETIASLREIRSRIQTIGLIHETLYEDESVDQIDFNQYLKQLCFQIMEMYAGAFDKEVQLEISCKGLFLDLPKSVLLAMIVNELITNSYKHAFKAVSNPIIKITYDPQVHILEYTDNGPGYEPAESNGVHGYSLIQLFSKQLNVRVQNQRKQNFFSTQLIFQSN